MADTQEAWMIVLCGPNGAGKSTFYENVLKPDPFFKNIDFINMDVEAAKLAGKEGNVYNVMLDAGRNVRNRLKEKMQNFQSFIYETTTSGRTHIGLIREAQKLGFKVATIFIGLSSAQLSLLRVKERVNNGGHDVPHKMIEQRFPNIIKNFPSLLGVSDISVAFDNSKKSPFELIFMMDERKLFAFHAYPKWLDTALQGRKISEEMVHITKDEFNQMQPEKITQMVQKVFSHFNKNGFQK